MAVGSNMNDRATLCLFDETRNRGFTFKIALTIQHFCQHFCLINGSLQLPVTRVTKHQWWLECSRFVSSITLVYSLTACKMHQQIACWQVVHLEVFNEKMRAVVESFKRQFM